MKTSFAPLLFFWAVSANPVPPPVHLVESLEHRISVLEFNQDHLRQYLSFVQQQLVGLNNQIYNLQEQLNELETLSSSDED